MTEAAFGYQPGDFNRRNEAGYQILTMIQVRWVPKFAVGQEVEVNVGGVWVGALVEGLDVYRGVKVVFDDGSVSLVESKDAIRKRAPSNVLDAFGEDEN